ncbi:MAG: hypothetical protein NTV52_26575 [Acidobacteria bacterium]|nr:hypothetical protein [Acidobacteriota bacterium]
MWILRLQDRVGLHVIQSSGGDYPMSAGFTTLAQRSDANDYYLESSRPTMHQTMVGITAPIRCGLDGYAL